jgi:4-amino-4-deoxy-L-arabinose transferase-like glycosyltransferase
MSRATRITIALVAVATVIRAALAAAVPLFPDEAYYWEWGRHLAAGYFDHPPAIALLIHAGVTVAGSSAFGARAGVILAGVVASFALVVTSSRLGVEAAADGGPIVDDPGVRAALLMLVIPVALVGFVIATPDAPLLAAIALTLAALERAIASPARSSAAFGWWCAAGVTLGLAFCSKYTSVLIPFGVLVALLSRRDLRSRLAEPGPYAAAAIALLMLLPTLLWNSHHEWISFAFQLHHGLGQVRGSVAGRELALVGGQLGLMSPIIAVMAVVAVARALRAMTDPRRYVLAVIAITVVAFFAVSALRRPVEPNWPLPALLAALPLLATMRLGVSGRRWLIAGSVLGSLCTVVVAAQAVARVIPASARRDPMSKAHGWQDLARVVQQAESGARGCSVTWLAADRYQDASELAFNLPDQPRVFALNLGGRPNQYDLWPGIYSVAAHSDCALVVVDEGAAGEAVVERLGADSAAIVAHAVMMWRGEPVARRAVWLVHGVPRAPLVEVELSPEASAALAASAAEFARHAALLDSIVAAYRKGAGPPVVTATAAAPLSNADRHAAIAARIDALHALLKRAGFAAVYRDARYPECTFVRSTGSDSTDLGYVHAPQGCRIAAGHGDALLRVAHARGPWYAYASPEGRHD